MYGALFGPYPRPTEGHNIIYQLEFSHLLVSRPSKSRALECFVSEIVGKSTHVAMLVCTSTAHHNISV